MWLETLPFSKKDITISFKSVFAWKKYNNNYPSPFPCTVTPLMRVFFLCAASIYVQLGMMEVIGGKWGEVQLGDPSELMSVANNQPENGFVCVFGILIFSSAIFLFDAPPSGGLEIACAKKHVRARGDTEWHGRASKR